jgi:hypothetical protein
MRMPKPAYASKICDEGLALDDPAAALVAAAPPLRGFDRQSRERVRHLERELRRPEVGKQNATALLTPFDSPRTRRFDAPANLMDGITLAPAASFGPIAAEPVTLTAARQLRSEGGQVFAWSVVFAGVLILAGGLGLFGWSLSIGDVTYWSLALGLTLGGQGLLIFGLALAVARLWRNSRYAANKLQDVHARLGQLQHTADALLAKNSGGAPAFYADLVRGASPQVLLANLKGQVDQLATRLGSGI